MTVLKLDRQKQLDYQWFYYALDKYYALLILRFNISNNSPTVFMLYFYILKLKPKENRNPSLLPKRLKFADIISNDETQKPPPYESCQTLDFSSLYHTRPKS